METIPLKQIPLTMTIESQQLLITTEKSCTSDAMDTSVHPNQDMYDVTKYKTKPQDGSPETIETTLSNHYLA